MRRKKERRGNEKLGLFFSSFIGFGRLFSKDFDLETLESWLKPIQTVLLSPPPNGTVKKRMVSSWDRWGAENGRLGSSDRCALLSVILCKVGPRFGDEYNSTCTVEPICILLLNWEIIVCHLLHIQRSKLPNSHLRSLQILSINILRPILIGM